MLGQLVLKDLQAKQGLRVLRGLPVKPVPLVLKDLPV